MPSPRFFQALCDPSRLAVLSGLAERGGTCNVSEIARCCPLSLSGVSRHLANLRDAGILRSVRRGKQVLYSIDSSSVATALRAMADALESCCPAGAPQNPPRPRGRPRQGAKS